MSAEEQARYYIHENAHSYGLSVVRDPALAHRYVVWVQPTYDPGTRLTTHMTWGEGDAFCAAAAQLRDWKQAA